MPDGDYVPVTNGGTGGDSAEAARTFLEVRRQLSSARTYYVRTDGSNLNDGLSNTSGGAFLTIQYAVDTASKLDNGGYDITIRIGAGTYTAPIQLKSYVGSGKIIIRGDLANMTSVLVSVTGDCFNGVIGSLYQIQYMKLVSSSYGLSCALGGLMEFDNIDFGACTASHLVVGSLGFIQATGNYTISGGSNAHWAVYDAGNLRVHGRTITITGTPAFSGQFANAERMGGMLVFGNTFSGSATGKRYNAALNGLVFTAGGGASYLPGDVAGTTATGGQYS